MESAQKLIETELTTLLKLIPEKIPPQSKKFIGPIANSLKLATRMLPDFPPSNLKGLEWLFDVLGAMAPGLIASLTGDQLRAVSYKAISLGLAILDAMPEEIEPREDLVGE